MKDTDWVREELNGGVVNDRGEDEIGGRSSGEGDLDGLRERIHVGTRGELIEGDGPQVERGANSGNCFEELIVGVCSGKGDGEDTGWENSAICGDSACNPEGA